MFVYVAYIRDVNAHGHGKKIVSISSYFGELFIYFYINFITVLVWELVTEIKKWFY